MSILYTTSVSWPYVLLACCVISCSVMCMPYVLLVQDVRRILWYFRQRTSQCAMRWLPPTLSSLNAKALAEHQRLVSPTPAKHDSLFSSSRRSYPSLRSVCSESRLPLFVPNNASFHPILSLLPTVLTHPLAAALSLSNSSGVLLNLCIRSNSFSDTLSPAFSR